MIIKNKFYRPINYLRQIFVNGPLFLLGTKLNNSTDDKKTNFRYPFIAKESKNACSNCQICVEVCPTDCLEIDSTKDQFKINEYRCTQCALCVEVCPENVIELSDPEDKKELKPEWTSLLRQ